MIAASFNTTTVGANVMAILLGFAALGAAFARYGKRVFGKAVKEEVAPALAALERHAKEAQKGSKKLKKQQVALAAQLTQHSVMDNSRFDQDDEQSAKILTRLDVIETQGTDAAEKVVLVATEAAERAATVAVSTALATEKVAADTALAAEKVAAEAAERVADVAAAKAVALLEAAQKDTP